MQQGTEKEIKPNTRVDTNATGQFCRRITLANLAFILDWNIMLTNNIIAVRLY